MKFRNILIIILIILIYISYNLQYFYNIPKFSLRKLQIAVENNEVTKYRKMFEEIRTEIPNNANICYLSIKQKPQKQDEATFLKDFFLIQYGIAPLLLQTSPKNCDYVILDKQPDITYKSNNYKVFKELNNKNIIYKRIKSD